MEMLEFLLAGELVWCDEAVVMVMSIVACYLSNRLQGYCFSRQAHLQIFIYFLSFFSKTSVSVKASGPTN
jgi:hypothetical protein